MWNLEYNITAEIKKSLTCEDVNDEVVSTRVVLFLYLDRNKIVNSLIFIVYEHKICSQIVQSKNKTNEN